MSEKLKIVVVGLRFGLEVIRRDELNPTVAEPNIEIKGICDMDAERLKAACQELNLRGYASLDEVLADEDVEAVALFTGPRHRAELIGKIIRAGKHVMTTKPFELDPKAAREVLQEARKLNRVVHLNSPSPLPTQENEQILRWVDAYHLGQPINFHWETFGCCHEVPDGSWYDNPDLCPVAPIFRLGIYGINQVIALFGEVSEINVLHSQVRTKRPTPDNAILSMKFSSGTVGSLVASFCTDDGYKYPNDLHVNYEKGSISTVPVSSNQYGECADRKLVLNAVDADGNKIHEEALIDKRYCSGMYQWKNFYQAAKLGRRFENEISPKSIVNAVKVICAMRESEKTGQAMAL